MSKVLFVREGFSLFCRFGSEISLGPGHFLFVDLPGVFWWHESKNIVVECCREVPVGKLCLQFRLAFAVLKRRHHLVRE